MTHVTCRLTAKNRDQLWNPTLDNRDGLPLPNLTLPSSSQRHLYFPISLTAKRMSIFMLLLRSLKAIHWCRDQLEISSACCLNCWLLQLRVLRRFTSKKTPLEVKRHLLQLAASFFTLRNQPHLRGHKYVINKQRCSNNKRNNFFSNRIVNSWNNMPSSTTDFTDFSQAWQVT